jgi:hypothetical protein
MSKESQRLWFPAKKYDGDGAFHARQGWVGMLVYLVLVGTAGFVIRPASNIKVYLTVVFGLTFLLCLVCWWKGEKPAWSWGDKK